MIARLRLVTTIPRLFIPNTLPIQYIDPHSRTHPQGIERAGMRVKLWRKCPRGNKVLYSTSTIPKESSFVASASLLAG